MATRSMKISRPGQPDESINIAADATVSIDGAVVSAPAGTGDPNTGKSIFGDIIGKGITRTDKDGNLIDRDGKVYTHNAGGSLQAKYANLQMLLDDAARINFTREIVVDGTRYQQGLQPPVRYGSGPDGLTLADGPVAGTQPTAPVHTPEAKFTGGDYVERIAKVPDGRQYQFYTNNVGPGNSIRIEFPGGLGGRVRGVEKSGTTTTSRATVLDGKPMDDNGSMVQFDFGANAQKAVITAPGYDGAYGPCDMSIIVEFEGR